MTKIKDLGGEIRDAIVDDLQDDIFFEDFTKSELEDMVDNMKIDELW